MMFAPPQIYILLGATGVLLRLLFATTLRLAYGVRLLGATDPWTGIRIDGRADLYIFRRGTSTALRYRLDVPGHVVRSYVGTMGSDFISMRDNARSHTNRLYLDQAGIEVIE